MGHRGRMSGRHADLDRNVLNGRSSRNSAELIDLTNEKSHGSNRDSGMLNIRDFASFDRKLANDPELQAHYMQTRIDLGLPPKRPEDLYEDRTSSRNSMRSSNMQDGYNDTLNSYRRSPPRVSRPPSPPPPQDTEFSAEALKQIMKAVDLSEEKEQREVLKKLDDRNQREERMRQLREERRFGGKSVPDRPESPPQVVITHLTNSELLDIIEKEWQIENNICEGMKDLHGRTDTQKLVALENLYDKCKDKHEKILKEIEEKRKARIEQGSNCIVTDGVEVGLIGDGGNHYCDVTKKTFQSINNFLSHLHSRNYESSMIPVRSRPWTSVPNYEANKLQLPKVFSHNIIGAQYLVPAKAFYCKCCRVFMGDQRSALIHLSNQNHYQAAATALNGGVPKANPQQQPATVPTTVATSSATPTSLYSSLQGNPTGFGGQQNPSYTRRTDRKQDQDIDDKMDYFVARLKDKNKVDQSREYRHRENPYSRSREEISRSRATPGRRGASHSVTEHYRMKISPLRDNKRRKVSPGGRESSVRSRRNESSRRSRSTRRTPARRRSRSRKREASRRRSPSVKRRRNSKEKKINLSPITISSVSPESKKEESETNVSFQICKKKKNTDPVVVKDLQIGNHGDHVVTREVAKSPNVTSSGGDNFKVTLKVLPPPSTTEPPPPGTY